MSSDPSACFSPNFIAGFEAAAHTLPSDHRLVTWANSEKGLVAALVGPLQYPFMVAIEEGLVILLDKSNGQKLQTWPVAGVTGETVANLIRDVLAARAAPPPPPPQR